ATVAAIRKLSAKKKFQQTQHFFRSLTLNLIFWCGFGKPGTLASPATANETVPYNLYRSRFLCLCAFIRLRRLCLAIFAFLRFLKNGCHVGGNRVRPGVAVVTGIVAVQMTKVGDERCARINRQKDLFQYRVRYRHRIVWHLFRMWIVQSKIQRGERELASIK